MSKGNKKGDFPWWKKFVIWISISAPTIIALLSTVFVVVGYWYGTNIVRIVAICCLCALGICGMICCTVFLVKLLPSRRRSEPSGETLRIMCSAYEKMFRDKRDKED